MHVLAPKGAPYTTPVALDNSNAVTLTLRGRFMPRYQALSQTTHSGLRFQRYTSYAFAAQDAVAPLVQQELVKACMQMPVAFIQQGEHFCPAAVQGFLPGKNLWVGADGRWVGGYVPAVYRSHPFALLPNEAGQMLLCVDADSGLLHASQGETLFDAEGSPTQAVKDVLGFLEQVARNRQATQAICAVLAQHQLIQPWPLQIQTAQGEQAITGLFRIDEAALNQLEAPALKTLQACGALAMAYMQLLSMQHMEKLAQQARRGSPTLGASQPSAVGKGLPVNSRGELDLEFLNQGGTLSFAGL